MKLEVFILGGQRRERRDGGEARGNEERERGLRKEAAEDRDREKREKREQFEEEEENINTCLCLLFSFLSSRLDSAVMR